MQKITGYNAQKYTVWSQEVTQGSHVTQERGCYKQGKYEQKLTYWDIIGPSWKPNISMCSNKKQLAHNLTEAYGHQTHTVDFLAASVSVKVKLGR